MNRSRKKNRKGKKKDECDKREEHQFRLLGIKINLSYIYAAKQTRKRCVISSLCSCNPLI